MKAILTCLTTQGSGEVKDLVVQGCNLHILNGMGSTSTKNGKGNLIIGYNEEESAARERDGSHNLVVGPEHSYSSYGGFVAGYQNTISGGRANTASERYASVSAVSAHGSSALWKGEPLACKRDCLLTYACPVSVSPLPNPPPRRGEGT